ncbi:MAG: ATP-binding protein [Gemmatimonadota bacterium]|nr:ATP-binding protein [Gemmatimonadota bacterium]
MDRRVEHRQGLERLGQTQDLVQTIVECVADGLLLVDDSGEIRFANPAAAALFDRRAADLVGTQFGFPIVAGETTEIELVRRGGTLITAELRVTDLPWQGKNARLVSLRDITERKAAEEAARQLAAEQAARREAEAAEGRAERLADASRLLASSLDYEATLCLVAEAVVPVLGDWCAVDVLTKDGTTRRLAARHSDPQKVRWAEELRHRYLPDPDAPIGVPNVLRTGKPEFYPHITDELLVQVARDEEHLAVLRGIGFRSAIIVPLVARGRTLGAITLACGEERCFSEADLRVAEDLASRSAVAVDNARLYQEAQAAEAEAEQARAQAESANQSKSAFLAMMSHELRTPLNAIGGYAQLMEEGIPGPVTEGQREYLKRVRRSQEHLEALINDVLDFAKLEAGRLGFEFTEFALAENLPAVVALVEPQTGAKELRFEYRGGDPAVVVYADRDKVLQIVLNLVSNAVKFTAPGSRIAVDWICSRQQAHIRVADTGTGIPPEKLSAVFEPFFQADRNVHGASHGTGLGLTISRDLARRMDGDITVESEVGVGSTFTLTLPLAAAQREPEEPILERSRCLPLLSCGR